MATQTTPYTAEPIDTSRFEQVDGKLIERNVPTLKHGKLQRFVTSALLSAATSQQLDAVQEVSINHWDKPKSDWMTPDVIVSEPGGFREAQNGHVLPPIALAVEVLSPSQSVFNMQWKVKELLEWGVRQVWLVDPESSSVAVFNAPGKSELFSDGNLKIADTGIDVLLSDLFSERAV